MRLFNAALAAISMLAMAPAAEAVDRDADTGTRLTLTATGHSEAPPDLAILSLGVVTTASSAARASADNARRMTALTEALRAAGVGDRDVQTAGISIGPQYVYQQNVPPRITGYQASNTLIVRVRRLDSLGTVIDAAISAGGNTLNSVAFAHSDPSVEQQAARRNAAIDARARADAYAAGFGLHVTRVVSVREQGARGGDEEVVVTGTIFRNNNNLEARPTTPVVPGELSTDVQIDVTFELR